jgi:hypothetical protein
LHDIGREGDTDFLVMELVEGDTLSDRLARGPMPLDRALAAGADIAAALAAAHRTGVLHRDIKPGNVMLSKSGAKLLDFGLAKLQPPHVAGVTGASVLPTQESPASAAGAVLGTLPYMAPEQLAGKEVDARSDIFALGAVLYEMITGRRAFNGNSSASVISAIMSSQPTPIASLVPRSSPGLERLIGRCLAKDPDERWDTAHDVEGELPWIADAGSAVAAAQPQRWSRYRTAGFAAAAVAVLAALFGAGAKWGARAKPLVPRPLVMAELGPEPAERFGGAITATAGGGPRALAFSPGGETLVFVGTSGKTSRLFLRSLDRETAVPIPGTEDASSPFFSADGRWIGFWAADQLKRVAGVEGLPGVVLGPSGLPGIRTLPGDAAWADDGRIVVGQMFSTLWAIPEAGGKPAPITELRPGEVGHVHPCVLPGSKAFLFTVRRKVWTWGDEEIVVQPLPGGERRTLIRNGANPHYVSTGHLVFLRLGTLMAVPFDLARLEVTGAEVAPVQDVAQSTVGPTITDALGMGHFAVSDAGPIVYAIGRSPTPREYSVVWVDRAGRLTPTSLPVRAYAAVRLSPDGRHVLTTTNESTARIAWLCEPSRGTVTRLDTGGAELGSLIWSPDGQRVVTGRSSFSGTIFEHSILGGQAATPLAADAAGGTPLSWSPDGRYLAFGRNAAPGAGYDVWILDATGPVPGARPYLTSPANEIAAAFSPRDGRFLAYESDESGRPEVYLRPFPGAGPGVPVSSGGGTSPAWRGDQRELFYVGLADAGGRRWMMSVDVATTPTLTLGLPRPLFEITSARLRNEIRPARGWDVSADGQRFLFTVAQGTTAQAPPLTRIRLALNWTDTLKVRVPAKPR